MHLNAWDGLRITQIESFISSLCAAMSFCIANLTIFLWYCLLYIWLANCNFPNQCFHKTLGIDLGTFESTLNLNKLLLRPSFSCTKPYKIVFILLWRTSTLVVIAYQSWSTYLFAEMWMNLWSEWSRQHHRDIIVNGKTQQFKYTCSHIMTYWYTKRY